MEQNKYYYICGIIVIDEYEETFEKIIEDKNKKDAKIQLLKKFCDFKCQIEQIYETSWDAII